MLQRLRVPRRRLPLSTVALGLVLALGCSRAGRDRAPRAARPDTAAAEATPRREAPVEARRTKVEMSPEAASAYAAGMAAFAKADLKGASEQFSRAFALDRAAIPAMVGLGIVQERRGELAKALDSYGMALSITPDYGPALSAKVRLLLGMGRISDAEAFARDAAAKYPDSAGP